MKYEIKDGKIQSSKCELNVVHHCNMSCRSCSHLSPVMKKYYMSPDAVYADLSVLGKYYHADYVRILGGEPTLHPNIDDILQAARSSGVGSKICVITNGLLLWRMSDRFWELVDEINISVYPSSSVTPEQREICERQIQKFSVRVDLKNFDKFRESHSEIGTSDQNLINQIYTTCQIAHHWRCFNVQDGYFYKCPQALFLPTLLGDTKLRREDNGIKIEDTPEFGQKLLSYLESKTPLPACQYCLGSVGKLFMHEQVSRKQWSEYQKYPTEDLIDYEYLKSLAHLEQVDPDFVKYYNRSLTRADRKNDG